MCVRRVCVLNMFVDCLLGSQKCWPGPRELQACQFPNTNVRDSCMSFPRKLQNYIMELAKFTRIREEQPGL